MKDCSGAQWKSCKDAARCVVLRPDGEGFPLSQPQPTHGTLGGGSCPGTPEMRRRQEEAMRRLASQVTHTPVTVPRYIWDCLRVEVNHSTSILTKFRFFFLFFHPLATEKSALLLIWNVKEERRYKSKAQNVHFYLPPPSSPLTQPCRWRGGMLSGTQVEAGTLTCLS